MSERATQRDETTGIPDARQEAALESTHHYLMVFEADSAQVFPLPSTGSVQIGRGEAADLRVASRLVSRQHARLAINEGEVLIVDLGSQNGLWVNDERLVGSRALSPGDTVRMPGVVLVYHGKVRFDSTSRPIHFEAFRRRLAQEIERSNRFHRTLAVLAFGGQQRDRVMLSSALVSRIRLIDVVGYGPEGHILVMLPEAGVHAAHAAARRLLELVAREDPDVRVGLATVPEDGCDPDSILVGAHAAASSAAPGEIKRARDVCRHEVFGEHDVLISDPAMLRLYELLHRLAGSDIPVLIGGETGTGKELAAAALHHWSTRRDARLVSINCSALPDGLAEAELFGYERGAFTGAQTSRQGLFESASGGTVFLDELGDLSRASQARLLRVLETGRVMPVGGRSERAVDVRVIAASNKSLDDEIAAGRFRDDLFFRLSAATVWIPPLRSRPREIPIFAEFLLRRACERMGKPAKEFSSEAMRELALYNWPGNVRELKNVTTFAAAATDGEVIERECVAEYLGPARGGGARARARARPPAPAETESLAASGRVFRPLSEELRELELRRMREALDETSGNRTRAAKLLHMPLRTFVHKLKRYSLT